jgi:RNA polymerase sigma-70 factor (ECF subfamily)
LLALFCFQASRLGARLDDQGNIVLLKYQDRSQWYRPLIQQGNYFLEMATEKETSVYHLEAAIAWLHATAPDFESTNWNAIYHLYTILAEHHPSDIISLNKAIAAAYAVDRQTALRELHAINGLKNYHLYHTALGEIYLDEGCPQKAKQYFEHALSLSRSRAEHELLRAKIMACNPSGSTVN